MDEVFERIKKFVVEQRWERPLERSTSLQLDLRLYGDDVNDFIHAFSKEFNVDISEFKASDYFNSESDPFYYSFIKIFSNKQKKNITLGDLEEAVKIGKLL